MVIVPRGNRRTIVNDMNTNVSQTLPGSEPAASQLATAEPDPASGEGTTLIARRDAQQKIENAAIIDTTLDD